MTNRIRFHWPMLAAALTAATMLVALKTSPGARLLDDPAQDAWLKSGDPCYPTKQNKKYIESMGADSSYMHCVPLTVEVLWESQEVVHHHAGLGTSHANFSFRDKFPAFLELVYKSPKSQELANFHIQAPAPCCPGSAETAMESADVALVGCGPAGRNCKPFALSDSLYFTLEIPTDTALGFTWDETEGPHANLNSSRVQLDSGRVVPEPWRAIGGLNLLGSESLQVDVRGKPAFTPEDINKLIQNGEVQAVFSSQQATTAPGLPVSGSQSIKATVKLLFTSDWEKWRVTVQGWEEDTIRPDIRYTQSGVEKSLPIHMEFNWTLEGEFIIRNPKKNPTFDSGKVTKAGLTPQLVFQGGTLYKCTFRTCDDTYEISKLPGALLSGSVNGKSLTLTWPKYSPSQCVFCTPLKLFLGKKAYRQNFGSQEFMRVISGQNLVLQNGYSITGKYHDWMTYTISLKKIQ
jgi:hypothetical protein